MIQSVWQYCDKCKTNTSHKFSEEDKLLLVCGKCKCGNKVLPPVNRKTPEPSPKQVMVYGTNGSDNDIDKLEKVFRDPNSYKPGQYLTPVQAVLPKLSELRRLGVEKWKQLIKGE